MPIQTHFLDKEIFHLCAHRGNCMGHVENTLAAFKQAIASGATMIEFDLQLSKDGVVEIFHDTTLWRLSKSMRRVSSLTSAKLREYTLCQTIHKKRYEGSITSFEELLDSLGKGVNYYAEVKYSKHLSPAMHEDLCQKVYEHVASRGLLQQTLFVSFERVLLDHFRALDARCYLGWNFSKISDLNQNITWAKKTLQALCPKEKLIKESWLKEIKEEGYRLIPWVVNDLNRMRELKSWGVNGITTDLIEQLVIENR